MHDHRSGSNRASATVRPASAALAVIGFRPTVDGHAHRPSPRCRWVLLAAWSLAACGSTPKHAEMVTAPGARTSRRPRRRPHACDDKGKNVITADVNEDKSPTSGSSSRPSTSAARRRSAHLQGGRPQSRRQEDLVYYYDDKGGKLTLEESDLDFDGKFDLTIYYASGKMVREELDTNFDSRDVWKFFENEKLVAHRARHERRRQGRRVGVLRGRQARSHRLRHHRLGPGRPLGPRAGERGRGGGAAAPRGGRGCAGGSGAPGRHDPPPAKAAPGPVPSAGPRSGDHASAAPAPRGQGRSGLGGARRSQRPAARPCTPPAAKVLSDSR